MNTQFSHPDLLSYIIRILVTLAFVFVRRCFRDLLHAFTHLWTL